MLFFKKNKKESNQENKSAAESSFCFGVEAVFRLTNSDDVVVVGDVHGTVKTGQACYISNFGDDDTPISLSTIAGLEVNRQTVNSATNTPVGIKIENGSKLEIKTGTVIYSRDTSTQDAHNAYVKALYKNYIVFEKMKLEASDYEKMSLTDLVELRRLYQNHLQEAAKKAGNPQNIDREKLDEMSKHICEKILASKEIYVLKNKITGEPHMYSQVYVNNDGDYVTTPPDILLITKPYLEVWKRLFAPEQYEFEKIEAGEDGKGIYNFLGSTFYLNGACGVMVLYRDFAIEAGMLVEKPDITGVPSIQIPVTNPDVERWLLLIGQLGEAQTEDEKKIYTIFVGHLFRNLANAKLLAPMRLHGEIENPDSEGKTVLKKDTTIDMALCDGKGERMAVPLYTDWKRFLMKYKHEDGWDGMIQSISGLTGTYDCMINPTEYTAAGCYIDEEFYKSNIEQFVEKE